MSSAKFTCLENLYAYGIPIGIAKVYADGISFILKVIDPAIHIGTRSIPVDKLACRQQRNNVQNF